MKNALLAAMLFAGTVPLAPAFAQNATITQSIAGTRLDLDVVGEVTRIPNVATISAGAVSRAPTASGAFEDSAQRMQRVLNALKRAGIEDRDIQTSNISLTPEYRYVENQPPQLVGYTATNNLTVRLRDIRASGRILDQLVAQGANQINGLSFSVENPEGALNEARASAVATGKSRADLYARSLGMRVVRLVAVNEGGGNFPGPVPLVQPTFARAATNIQPGEEKLSVNLHLTFELQ